MQFFLGIDFGTSGARAIVIDKATQIQAQAQFSWTNSSNWTNSWREALFFLIEQIPQRIRQQIRAIALNGTSATVLLCNTAGDPIDAPMFYDDGRGVEVMESVRAIAPPSHVVISATSSLSKLLWWHQKPIYSKATYFLHQADWLAFLLHGKLGISDYHNALKLGYDTEKLCYPSWLTQLPIQPLLPQVVAPGTPVGKLKKEISQSYGFPSNCLVCSGTTDSIAAFLASGANTPGEAVTSIGSTLVLKLLSKHRVEDSRYGIYSHRLGDLWLTGGASNTGGAVLRHFFNDEELIKLSSEINPDIPSNLDYYPLLQKGERFPINNPELLPQLEPRPDNKITFLHGLLESMAKIEARGYELLQSLGATRLNQVYTAGGGARNATWSAIRQRYLNVSVTPSQQTQAAYGTALLAKGNR